MSSQNLDLVGGVIRLISTKPICIIPSPNGIGVDLLSLSICPYLGAALNLDMAATCAWRSNLPEVTIGPPL